jgi:photosystem II stability/assembly factor-like uncharacterized protein
VNYPKLSLAVRSCALLFLISCNKGEGEVITSVDALSVDGDEITYACSFEVLQNKYTVNDMGIWYGTAPDPAGSGIQVSHGTGSNEFSGSLNNLDYGTTYYIQAYVDVDGTVHYSDVASKTIGGGWNELDVNPNQACSYVALTPAGIVHAVGSSGAHFYSTNEGESWSPITHSTAHNLAELKFIDENTAYVQAGNELRKSTDGGMTWMDIAVAPATIDAVCYYDAATLFVANYDSIYRSTNSGATWAAAFVDLSVGGDEIEEISFVSPAIGYALAGEGDVFKTTNGGISWINLGPGIFPVADLRQCYFINASTGIAGLGSSIYRTTTGGISWTSIYEGSYYSKITEIHFCDEQNGVFSTYDGHIARTTNGGLSWIFDPVAGGDADMMDVEMLNASTAYAINEDGIIFKYR